MSELKTKIPAFARTAAGSLPFGLKRDVLYLWSTFRLRRRPLKILTMLIALALMCMVWQWVGREWAQPRLLGLLRVNPHAPVFGFWLPLRQILVHTVYALFSSLNIMSCIAIVVMARSLRRLLKEGHLESLMLTPGRIRPSSLYYAIASRYLPLSLVAVLLIYIQPDPQYNPLKSFPFAMPPHFAHADAETMLAWGIARELSVFFFCPANLFMDLALAFWIFSRWRLSYPTVIGAVVVIGLITPVALMTVLQMFEGWVGGNLAAGTGLFSLLGAGFRGPPHPAAVTDIARSLHYFSTALLSLAAGFGILIHLDRRWDRMVRSPRVDPVMIARAD